MRKSFNLRVVKKSDWKVLLESRNDKITRQNFFNSDRYDSKATVTQTPQSARPRGQHALADFFEVPGEAAWVRPPNLQRVVASSC